MPIGEGGRPCFLGSTGLGRWHLGNFAIWLRDSAVYPRGIACLPRGIVRGITCLRIVIRGSLWGPKPCRVPDCWECLGKDCNLCLGKSAVSWGSLGIACLVDCTLCLGKSDTYWGSLGDITLCHMESNVCLGRLGIACLGDHTLCLGKSVILWGSLGVACLGVPAWETALCTWERVLSTKEAWELPAWWTVLSAEGRALSAWEVWGEALGVIDLHAWELLNLVSLIFSINSWHC